MWEVHHGLLPRGVHERQRSEGAVTALQEKLVSYRHLGGPSGPSTLLRARTSQIQGKICLGSSWREKWNGPADGLWVQIPAPTPSSCRPWIVTLTPSVSFNYFSTAMGIKLGLTSQGFCEVNQTIYVEYSRRVSHYYYHANISPP